MTSEAELKTFSNCEAVPGRHQRMRDRGRDLRTTLELVRANSSAECGSFCRAHRAAARGVCNSTRKAASPRRVTTCMQVMDATDAAVVACGVAAARNGHASEAHDQTETDFRFRNPFCHRP